MDNNKKLKIVLIDDHTMFRSGLKSLIEQDNIGEVVFEASNAKDFLEVVSNLNSDIVLMDIDMPGMNGVEASEKALQIKPDLKILILSMFDDYSYYSGLINLGVKGYISKSSGKTELERGIQTVMEGEYYFSSDLLRNIIIDLNKPKNVKEEANGKDQFSSREMEILKLICNGYDTSEIASKLFLSPKTIENHRSRMLQKSGTRNTVNLIIYAIKNGLITI